MNGTEFRKRRTDAGYKRRSSAAMSIGVAYDTVKDWELGRHPVPQYAIKWLDRVEAHARKRGRR